MVQVNRVCLNIIFINRPQFLVDSNDVLVQSNHPKFADLWRQTSDGYGRTATHCSGYLRILPYLFLNPLIKPNTLGDTLRDILRDILWGIEEDGVAASGVDGDEDVDERALVVGLNGGAWRAVLFESCLNGGDAGRLVRVNAHKDVATAQVVKVVGKSTDTVIMLSGFQPFLNSMRLDSIFCLLSRSVMLIGSAIFLLTCF